MAKVIIIGGGASGMVAAITASKNNNEVIILERNNKCGKKILITGNGRCNYWNSDQDISHYHSSNLSLINNIINDNNINKALDFFDNIGLVPKIKNGYYYPYSSQAVSINNILLKECLNNNVKIIYNCYVNDVKKINNKFHIYSNDCEYVCDKVIMSTGGKSYSKTGSDGHGYEIAEGFGHTIIKTLPALVQLIGDFKYCKDWDGIRIDSKISLYENNKFIKEEFGELQLTSYGVSGICAMQLSGDISRGLDNNKCEDVVINFLPFINDSSELLEWLNKRNNVLKNRNISELLDGVINYKLVNIILKISNIDDTRWDMLDDSKKSIFVNNIVNFKLNIVDTKSFDYAQTTSGGISLDEINNNLESKIVKNLYFTGELLDIYGDCGGYNLSIAFITGLIAGEDV